MVKLVTFDSERFLADAEIELAKRGPGAKARMQEYAGLSHQTVRYIFTNRRVTDIEVIMSIAQALGLIAFNYRVVRQVSPSPEKHVTWRASQIYDWKLFALCASMICWGKSSILARQIEGMPRPTASRILRGGGCPQQFMRPLCILMHLKPETFLRDNRRYQSETKPRKAKKKRSSRRLPADRQNGNIP